MTKNRIGIDPGKASFICCFRDDGVSFYKIPMIGKEIDLQGLKAVFEVIVSEDCHAVIEDVHSIFGSSAKSNWEFGRTVGMLETMLVAFNIPYSKIQPKKWQHSLWEGIPLQKKGTKTDTKATSLLAAQRLFPDVDLRKSERARVADHNKVDSLLIAEYCRRNF